MKSKVILFLVCASIIILGVLSGCKKKDVVNDYPHMTDALHQGFPLAEFKAADSVTKQAMIDEYRPLLVNNIRRTLGDCISPKDIKFVFGSGYAKKVENASGKTASGRFNNELIIMVNSPCKKGNWFLACGNGMLGDFNFTSSHDYGDGCQIIIKYGESLAFHWPMLQQWASTAQDLSVPIRNDEGKIVKAKIYKHFLGQYESVLFPGDRLNVCTGEVRNTKGQLVDFKRRLQETNKANKAIADSVAAVKKKQAAFAAKKSKQPKGKRK